MVESSKTFGKGIWLDPCSGIGNLSWHLANFQKDPEDFILNRLILSDKDPLALFIARTLFAISFQKNDNNFFNSISKNFIEFDFLSVADNAQPQLFESKNELSKIPKHNFVIVNPPYLAIKENTRFETSKSSDLYSYFLENIIKTSEGFISIIPQSYTNAAKFKSLRKLLLENYNNLTIYTFDNVPANIFKGFKFGSKNSNKSNSIRASILIAKQGQGEKRITQLIRWRSDERDLLFANLEQFPTAVAFTEDFFPKVGRSFQFLYQKVSSLPSLGSIIVNKKTKYALYVPSAPRYFISALKKPVQRTSQKTLFFANKEDRDYAYLLINSSFMYWWWRVRDGGMTLSLQTITSLPLLKFRMNIDLLNELSKSETKSKVYKQNAGALQENVKHPKELISKLNKVVIPEFAGELIKLHGNSDISIHLNN
jgi:tRNA1(Val) A37 N6-methylase TrmN6